MLTVVLKLLHLTGADVAFFGEKDFQQLALDPAMVADLDMPVTIVGVPTVREADGLALSSRNRYLRPEQRRAALALSRALAAGVQAAPGGRRPFSTPPGGARRPSRPQIDRLDLVDPRRSKTRPGRPGCWSPVLPAPAGPPASSTMPPTLGLDTRSRLTMLRTMLNRRSTGPP